MQNAGPLVPDAVQVVEAGLARRRGRRLSRPHDPAQTVGSVVIPAHNEAKVIRRGLSRLFDSLGAGVEVIAACNGCTDGTADMVRAAGHRVTVIELDVASKAEALRAADRVATAFPRIYLDADVLVSGTVVHAVLEHLSQPGALAARPPLVYDTSSSSWVVRRFYRARAQLPAVMRSLWGAGMYALSAEGRARFDEFPLLVADDLFVDRLFRPEDIAIVDTAPVVVVASTTAAGLLASLRRTFRGNRAIGDLAATDRPGTRATVRDLGRLAPQGPTELVDAVVYAAVVIWARALAWGHSRTSRVWERDDTSRR
jgi:cellulose synthase/poly-beta-1,6-N-acetylglucosamine synthase-like glycosyltransferase